MADVFDRRDDVGRQARVEPFRRRLVIMVKEPVAGRVKTRLAHEVGTLAAVRFYRANMKVIVRRLGADPRWQTVLSVAPPTACASRHLPFDLPRVPQASGDIGARMQNALAHPLGPCPAAGPVVLIGSDIATVCPAHIWDAFRALARNDIVFGPAADGGFWLVGLSRTPLIREVFPQPITWSRPTTLADCLTALGDRTVGFVETLSDTDSAADLDRLGPAAGRLLLPR